MFSIQDTTPPVIVATGGGTYWSGTTVLLDASNSTDNSEIVNVTWMFTYNGTQQALFGAVVSFVFGIPGQYDINVTVTDSNGTRAFEILQVLIITDTTPPGTPTIQSVEGTSPGCLRVTWGMVQDPDLAGYRLSRWNASRDRFELVVELPGTATSHEDCNLEYDRVYTYWIVSFDDSGNESPPSAFANGRTTSPGQPGTDLLPYQIAIGLLVLLVAALAIVSMRGSKKPPDQGEPISHEGRDARE